MWATLCLAYSGDLLAIYAGGRWQSVETTSQRCGLPGVQRQDQCFSDWAQPQASQQSERWTAPVRMIIGRTCYYYDFWRQTTTTTTTHADTHLTALLPGLPGWAGTRKVKPIWILLKQETVSGSGISWAICKSAPRSRQITTPAPHHSVFYRPDALPAAQSTASKHWRQYHHHHHH